MMSAWKTFCTNTHFHGFNEMYNSKSKSGKAAWFIVVAVSLLTTAYLLFQTTSNFLAEPVRVKMERVKPNQVYYPPMKLCIMHWMGWVNWTAVQEANFSKAELLYSMSYLSEKVYASDFFNTSEVEEQVKSKLWNKNMTLKDFFESITQNKMFFKSPTKVNDCCQKQLQPIPYAYRENMFDIQQLMCYTFSETAMLKIMNEAEENRSIEKQGKGYELVFDVQNPFEDDRYQFLNEQEISNTFTDIKSEWHMGDWKNKSLFKIMYYADGHSASVLRYMLTTSIYSTELKLSAYSNKDSPKTGRICREGKKHVSLNLTFTEACLEQQRYEIFRKNEVEEKWLGYTDDIRPRKIYFLDQRGKINQSLTYERRHKLDHWFRSAQKIDYMRNVTNEARSVCSTKRILDNGCEVWDVKFHQVKNNDFTDSNGMRAIYPRPDEIVMVKEVDMHTWSNFMGSVGGVIGIFTGISMMTFLQIFHLCCGCHGRKLKT